MPKISVELTDKEFGKLSSSYADFCAEMEKLTPGYAIPTFEVYVHGLVAGLDNMADKVVNRFAKTNNMDFVVHHMKRGFSTFLVDFLKMAKPAGLAIVTKPGVTPEEKVERVSRWFTKTEEYLNNRFPDTEWESFVAGVASCVEPEGSVFKKD